MENPKGEKILTVKSNYRQIAGMYIESIFDVHEINTMDGKNIAKFEIKSESVKNDDYDDTDHNNTCILQINDLDFDKKCLMGFIISYLANEFDSESNASS